MLLHMCHFMSPMIATIHILLIENAFDNFDIIKTLVLLNVVSFTGYILFHTFVKLHLVIHSGPVH